jgi:hypothetical protein
MGFLEDHMAGAHQKEIVGLMEKIEPSLRGHPRAVVLITLTRLIAAMLGPAAPETRQNYLAALPATLSGMFESDGRDGRQLRTCKCAIRVAPTVEQS